MLEQFAKNAVARFAKASLQATPHKVIINAAKAQGLRVAIDGELDEAGKNWEDMFDDMTSEEMMVDVYKGTDRIGSVSFMWADDLKLEFAVKPIKAKAEAKAKAKKSK